MERQKEIRIYEKWWSYFHILFVLKALLSQQVFLEY